VTRLPTLLDEIDSGAVLLPEFQRGSVWNRDQVRGLMRSHYRGYPVGGLLMWETTSKDVTVRYGPLETARKLLAAPAVSDGFAALWEKGRMDLTTQLE